ncbi:molybdopterin binding oxidoreductase [Testicularia cyperi]|uniref:Molybdopterin binding oxidoreductase n=1 Tax=Testicularia cyperi TaxID=1882483 RepID=A0A317XW08_9BASI|nr:molybdopterin binding oxidoreductase [Testicularia cyperi]
MAASVQLQHASHAPGNPDQLVRQQEPLNTEPYTDRLDQSFITPTNLVFHRNHDSVVDKKAPSSALAATWKLSFSVDASVQDAKLCSLSAHSWNIESIQKDYGHHEVVATLECAGNRRAEFSSATSESRSNLKSKPPPEGIQWGNAVIANVIWGGASMREILLSAGVPDPYSHHAASELAQLSPSDGAIQRDAAGWSQPLHLHLLSVQESSESDDPTRIELFGASIPLATAMHPNQSCLVAYRHNREPLLQCHGAPLRAVVPGHAGARWIKWLAGLKVSAHVNASPPMRQDYKLLVPPSSKSNQPSSDSAMTDEEWINKASHDPAFRQAKLDEAKPLQRLESNSSITQPWRSGTELSTKDSHITVKGYAVGQDGWPVDHVYVALVSDPGSEIISEDLLDSLPEDTTWVEAKLQNQADDVTLEPDSRPNWSWAWTLWQVQLPVKGVDGPFALIAKCVTANGIEQERISAWNLRGFCNRSWPVVRNLSLQSAQ